MIRVEYVLDDLPDDDRIRIEEDRGHLVFRIERRLTPDQMVSALNLASAEVLKGCHWFQEWKGDIVTADPAVDPEPDEFDPEP